MRTYWVYIMTNNSGTLYTGITGDLARRVDEHRRGLMPGFTRRYRITRLVHAESFSSAREAIAREKQIKGWVRSRKLALIAASNPEWIDLGSEWFGPCEAGEMAEATQTTRSFVPQDDVGRPVPLANDAPWSQPEDTGWSAR